MARIRSIKPEFWTAEQVMECSPLTRLAFIGMWNFCDDGGNHPASAKTLKAEVFPADDLTISDVQRLVDELLDVGLLAEYEAVGKRFWHVTGWHHQKIDRPTMKHPPFDERSTIKRQPSQSPLFQTENFSDCSTSVRRMIVENGNGGQEVPGQQYQDAPPGNPHQSSVSEEFDERSTSVRRMIDDQSPPEWSGVEGKGEEEHATGAQQQIETRVGGLCKQLRMMGFDAAPHMPLWPDVLNRFTDEEIMACAELAKAKKPGERLHINYLIPMLNDQSAPKQAAAGRSQRKPSSHSGFDQIDYREGVTADGRF
jgi:hypothetical protein